MKRTNAGIVRKMKKTPLIVVAVLFATAGVLALRQSSAATYAVAKEAESGVINGNAGPGDAAGASGTATVKSVKFGTTGTGGGGGDGGPLLQTVKIMPLGDSITAGQYEEVRNGYRLELLNRLPGYTIDYVGSYTGGDGGLQDKDFQARSGVCIKEGECYATPAMLPSTAGWLNASKPDVIIVNGGLNDLCCGRSDTQTTVQNSFTEWIQLMYTTLPNVHIVVIGQVEYLHPLHEWVPEFVAGQAAAGKKISYVSFDGIQTKDRIHPDTTGYQQLAERLATALKPIMTTLTGK